MSKARQLADLGNVYDDGALSNRNMVTNGAMAVAQRGVSFTGATTDGYYAIDRMKTKISSGASGTHTITQSTDAPIGFSNSYKIDCTTAEASPNQLRFMHTVEGYNVSHLNYNTSDAVETTLSFWVKSNVTGTYAFSIETTTSGRYFNTTYTISAANTWEYKTISIVGDTSSSLNSGNGIGLTLSWWLAAPAGLKGSGTPDTWVTNASYTSLADGHGVNIAGNTSNEWQITGVQLEVGDTATPFEHRSLGDELARCQRYYKRFETTGAEYQGFSAGVQYISTIYLGTMTYYPEMRAAPSFSTNRLNNNDLVIVGGNNTYQISAVSITGNGQSSRLNCASSGMTQGDGAYIQLKGGYVDFDAEL